MGLKHVGKLFPVLLIFALLAGCSAGRQGQTDAGLVIKLGAVTSGSVAGAGGAMLYGQMQNGDQAFAVEYDLNGGEFSRPLDNGVWDFWMLAWDGDDDQDTTPDGPLQGKPRCAFSIGNNLQGGDVTIILNLSNANCANSVVSDHTHTSAGFVKFPDLKLGSCLDMSVVSSETTYCDGTNHPGKVGHFLSYKIILPEFDKPPGSPTNFFPGTGFETACATISGGDPKMLSPFIEHIPNGDGIFPIGTVIRGFYDVSCDDSTPDKYSDIFLEKGLETTAPQFSAFKHGSSPTELTFFAATDAPLICSDGRESSTTFASGDGTNVPYGLCNADQFNNIGGASFGSYISSNFVVLQDLDFSGTTFVPVGDTIVFQDTHGTVDNPSNSYGGKFFGNNKTLSGFGFIDAENTEFVGLFRKIGAGAHIRDMRIDNLEFDCFDTDSGSVPHCKQMGILAGQHFGGTVNIDNVIISNSGVEGAELIGGFIGEVAGGGELIMKDVHVDRIRVTGNALLGGFIGKASVNMAGAGDPVIQRCSMTGRVQGYSLEAYVGGIIGQLQTGGTAGSVKECVIPRASIRGGRRAGGIVGKLLNGDITDNFVKATVFSETFGNSGQTFTGGIVGEAATGTIARNIHTLGAVGAGASGIDRVAIGAITGAKGSTCTDDDTNLFSGADNRSSIDFGGANYGTGCGTFDANIFKAKNANELNTLWGTANFLQANGGVWAYDGADNGLDFPRLHWETQTAPDGTPWENLIPSIKRHCIGLMATATSGTSANNQDTNALIIGTGTNFLSEYAAGDLIQVGGEIQEVLTVDSNTQITLTQTNSTGADIIGPPYKVNLDVGAGTAADPKLLCNVGQFEILTDTFGDSVHYSIVNDLDFKESDNNGDWSSFNSNSDGHVLVAGDWKFDSPVESILANIELVVEDDKAHGFFEGLNANAEITNLRFTGISFDSTVNTPFTATGEVLMGTLAAYNQGNVDNIQVEFSQLIAEDLDFQESAFDLTIGGLVGSNTGSITNSMFAGDIRLVDLQVANQAGSTTIAGLVAANGVGAILNGNKVFGSIEWKLVTGNARQNTKKSVSIAGLAAYNAGAISQNEVRNRIEVRNYNNPVDNFDEVSGSNTINSNGGTYNPHNNIEVGDTLFIERGLGFEGSWDANINSPSLADDGGNTAPINGEFYVVGVAGSTAIDGNSTWNAGDWIYFDGTDWLRFTAATDKVTGWTAKSTSVVDTNDGDIVLDTTIQTGLSNQSVRVSSQGNIAGLVSLNDGDLLDNYSRVAFSLDYFSGNLGYLVNTNSGTGTMERNIHEEDYQSTRLVYSKPDIDGHFIQDTGTSDDLICSVEELNNVEAANVEVFQDSPTILGSGTTFTTGGQAGINIGDTITINSEVFTVQNIQDDQYFTVYEHPSTSLSSLDLDQSLIPNNCSDDYVYDFTGNVFDFGVSAVGDINTFWDIDDFTNAPFSEPVWVFEDSDEAPRLFVHEFQ